MIDEDFECACMGISRKPNWSIGRNISQRGAALSGWLIPAIAWRIIKLVIKYQLYITPVTTYVLDDFYREN